MSFIWVPVQISISSILPPNEAAACIAWADCQGYPIASRYSAEMSREKAESIVADWREAKEAKDECKEEIPPMHATPITVKALHEYLSKILLLHPDAGNMHVQHVEFGSLTKSTEVAFDKASNSLYIA